MTTAGIALAAAAAAFVLVVLVTAVLLRARERSEIRMTRALGELGSRMESIAHDLGDAISHVQTENRRQQLVGDFGTSIDLDEVLARTVEAASLIPGVDASLVRATAHDGSTVAAATGLAAGLAEDAADRYVISGPPDGSDVRAVSLTLWAQANIFAGECYMGELALPARWGPVAFRLHYLKDPRGRAVDRSRCRGRGFAAGPHLRGPERSRRRPCPLRATSASAAAVVDVDLD